MERDIEGLLIDLDGVLYIGDEAIPGARDALAALAEQGIPCRFITNTTTRTAPEVVEKLRGFGFSVDPGDVFSAVSATRLFLQLHGGNNPRVHLLVRDSVVSEFTEFATSDGEDDPPDYVIVGDIGASWSYPLLNRAFRHLLGGAELIAMHKNKFFEGKEGLMLDIGAFVAGLEFVTGHTARVIGKPSLDFFRIALQSLELPPEKVAIVGDDIDNDIGGGQAAGLAGILVTTGKYRENYAAESGIVPDALIDSIVSLPALLSGE